MGLSFHALPGRERQHQRLPGVKGGLILVVAVGLWVGGALRPQPPEAPAGVRVGMTADQVRQLLGPPRRVARQILYRRYLEQWSYDAPAPRTIIFEYVVGQEPKVIALDSGKPTPP
jgi:hypothetical protein